MSAMASAYLSILPRIMICFFNTLKLFGFFVCPCYNKTTHPALEKPAAQNITVCENEVKQHKLSDH